MEAIVSRILDFLLTLPVILISLSVHEWAHGYSAMLLGDPTAKAQGRLTLNPIKHIDPIGFICMMFFHVGWAKPVPINSGYFKKPKRDIALCSLSGPLGNFILAFLFSFVFVLLARFSALFSSGIYHAITLLAYYMVSINVGLGVFNLIPIPPLDGSKILYAFLPYKTIFRIAPYEKYIQLGMLLLLWTGVLSRPIGAVTNLVFRLFILIAEGVIL